MTFKASQNSHAFISTHKADYIAKADINGVGKYNS